MKMAFERATELVFAARNVVVLSGAGMSAESGVPTFRDAQAGLWQRFAPEQLATEDAFRANPPLVWTWYVWRAMLVRGVQPNAGHLALGSWQQQLARVGGQLRIATQNVDDLHERGGAEEIWHLHGSLHDYRCLDCGKSASFDPASTGVHAEQEFETATLLEPISCAWCSTGWLRPAVVWFGEMLPREAFNAVLEALQQADLVVVVGSSGLVQPAASLPGLGQDAGAKLIEINPVATPLSQDADVYLPATAAVALPQLVSAGLTGL